MSGEGLNLLKRSRSDLLIRHFISDVTPTSSAKRIVGRGRNGQGEEPCRVDPFNADNQAEKRMNQEKKTCVQKASLKLNLRLANSLRSNSARPVIVSLRDAN